MRFRYRNRIEYFCLRNRVLRALRAISRFVSFLCSREREKLRPEDSSIARFEAAEAGCLTLNRKTDLSFDKISALSIVRRYIYKKSKLRFNLRVARLVRLAYHMLLNVSRGIRRARRIK